MTQWSSRLQYAGDNQREALLLIVLNNEWTKTANTCVKGSTGLRPCRLEPTALNGGKRNAALCVDGCTASTAAMELQHSEAL